MKTLINVGNKTYELDIEKAWSSGALKSTTLHCVGQQYIISRVSSKLTVGTYILSRVGRGNSHKSLVVLVNINTGNAWSNPVEVEDAYNLSDEEWNTIKDNDRAYYDVVLIENSH